MKTTVILFLVVVSSLSIQAREWTNAEGKTIQAELAEVVDDETIKLKMTANGMVYTYKIANLSEADQAYVAEEKEKREAAEKEKLLGNRKVKWHDNHEEALAESKELGLPIYMLFTGSDWCGYCIRLEEGVLSKQEFKEYAKTNLVLLKLDFPRDKKQKQSLKEQNAELKKEFGISGYPTVVLVDSEGKQLGKQVGYGGKGPADYVEKLKKMGE